MREASVLPLRTGDYDDPVVLTGAGATVRVETLGDGRRRVVVQDESDLHGACPDCVTSYPLALIREIYKAKGAYVCDEIRREEDPVYVEHSIRHEVLGYVDPGEFAGKRVLDFGCGSGASTMVLCRLLPRCHLVGIELEERLLRIARLRALHFGRQDVRFLQSPSGDSFPEGMGRFHYIVLSAVFEHLLPHERRELLPRLWRHLEPGGVLFLNQTPHRYSPFEWHTTGLPLINYLPAGLTLRAARRFSRNVARDASWEALLRAGIRGATIGEILGILATCGSPVLLEPKASIGDQIDLWHGKLSRRGARLKKAAWALLKLLKPVGGVHLIPHLALAIRKQA
jgi:2-polyprenyl-3-methyl-5-hydroxy-6-metoxy-1,4-benzoquinol methylase